MSSIMQPMGLCSLAGCPASMSRLPWRCRSTSLGSARARSSMRPTRPAWSAQTTPRLVGSTNSRLHCMAPFSGSSVYQSLMSLLQSHAAGHAALLRWSPCLLLRSAPCMGRGGRLGRSGQPQQICPENGGGGGQRAVAGAADHHPRGRCLPRWQRALLKCEFLFPVVQDTKTQRLNQPCMQQEQRFVVSCSCCTALEALLVLPGKVNSVPAGVR